MTIKIKKKDFVGIGRSVKPDSRRRVVLPSAFARKDIIYHIYANSDGQIILDPQVAVPASEAWVFQNPDVLELIQRGLSDVAEGRVSKIDLDTL